MALVVVVVEAAVALFTQILSRFLEAPDIKLELVAVERLPVMQLIVVRLVRSVVY
jgi:hypothetical protein